MGKIVPEIIEVDSSNLLLDSENPRLPESVSSGKNQEELVKYIKKNYDVEELASSISENGYFKAEPLIAIPEEDFSNDEVGKYNEYVKSPESKKYIVVEGNRRLTAIKLLSRGESDYTASDDVREQFKKLPVLLYPNRKEVLSFLGVRHLVGVRKWNVYERARYIVKLKRHDKMSIEKIQKIIGDRKNSAKKIYVCYRLIETVEEFDDDFEVRDSKGNFSFLQLATGQQTIRNYIGLQPFKRIKEEGMENPIPEDKKEKLVFLFKCLFDSRGRKALIRESRDITNKLKNVLGDEDATRDLEENEDIDSAYQLIGGDIVALEKISGTAKKKLQDLAGTLSGIKLSRINEKEEGKSFKENFGKIKEIVRSIEATLNQK